MFSRKKVILDFIEKFSQDRKRGRPVDHIGTRLCKLERDIKNLFSYMRSDIPVAARVRRLEKQMGGMRRKFETMYQSVYARSIRRHQSVSKCEDAAMKKAQKLLNHTIGPDGTLGKLGKFCQGLRKGRMPMTLTLQQFHRLTYLLRPKKKGFHPIKGPYGLEAVYLMPRDIKILRSILESVKRQAGA